MAERSVAIVTPSYGPDRERCRLLCDSIDASVTGFSRHYILVADNDAAMFADFAGPHREIVRESDILPERFLRLPTPGGRSLWLSTFAAPLRGWHLQQLRRISLAAHVPEDGLLYCDSDMAFVRPFDCGNLWRGDDFRLYRNPDGVHKGLPEGGREHMAWTRHAHALNGLAEPTWPAHDYINNLVSWRREDVLAMISHIEAVTGRPWLKAVTRQRAFSECQIYGAWISGVQNLAGHWVDETKLCRTRWSGSSLDEKGLRAFVEGIDPEQVAVGIQSFTGTDPAALRKVLNL